MQAALSRRIAMVSMRVQVRPPRPRLWMILPQPCTALPPLVARCVASCHTSLLPCRARTSCAGGVRQACL